MKRHAGPVDAVAVTPDGRYVLSAGRDRVLLRTDLKSGETAVLAEGPFHRLAILPDGRVVAGRSLGGAEVIGGPRLEGFGWGVCSVAVSPDGGTIAVGGDSCTVRLYDPDGRVVWVMDTYKWPYTVGFSPDGGRVFAATWRGDLYQASPSSLPGTEENPACPPGEDRPWPVGPLFAGTYLPDGRIALAGARSEDERGFVVVWREGEPEAEILLDAEEGVHALAVSGEWLAAGGNDGTVRVWSLPGLEPGPEWTMEEAGPSSDPEYPAYAPYYAARGSAVNALAFGQGGWLVAGTHAGEVLVLRPGEKKEERPEENSRS